MLRAALREERSQEWDVNPLSPLARILVDGEHRTRKLLRFFGLSSIVFKELLIRI